MPSHRIRTPGVTFLILTRNFIASFACLYCFLSSCETAHTPPVIGTTPGIIGVMQANEAIKFLV
ncbi:MAG: hypothetical protein LBV40_00675, partial [Methanomicrobiales archaeon]|nr:hypothetical protein [Methanomicrobiales archaeon]